MSESMSIESYLENGGRLTSPGNAPPRYRAELLRLMASFVDSELAGAAGFADMINDGPGIKERIAASKIVLEKTDNADRVLKIMGEFGANTGRYATHHPWRDRLGRDAPPEATRTSSDMRLSVFNSPLQGWVDAVSMNLLMGLAVEEQLVDLCQISYQPLSEAFRAIAPIEQRHRELAQEGLVRLQETGTAKTEIEASVDYWWPRVDLSFGSETSSRYASLQKWGLRHVSNGDLRAAWRTSAGETLKALGLANPG